MSNTGALLDLFEQPETVEKETENQGRDAKSSITNETSVKPPSIDTTPEAWNKTLSSVPVRYRTTVLGIAKRVYANIFEQLQNQPDRFKPADRNTSITTANAHISYCRFLPYHLVPENKFEEGCKILDQNPHQFLLWAKKLHPTADRLMVVGDKPDGAQVGEHLLKLVQSTPVDTLICGPGSGIDSALREYGRANDWVESHIVTIDYDRSGATWDQANGTTLDRLVTRLFDELKPDRIVAHDPVRLPANQAVLEEARKRHLPVLYVDPTEPEQMPKNKMRP